MAVAFHNKILFFLFLIQNAQNLSVYIKLPEITNIFNSTTHLQNKYINKICNNRDVLCRANNTNVCTMRVVNGNTLYKDFLNSCYLFLSNMCEYPGQEYNIVQSDTCENYMISRRNAQKENVNKTLNDTASMSNVIQANNDTNIVNNTNLRTDTSSTLYDIDTAFDYHLCPHSCPDVYSPVCINVNRGYGKYFKFMTFVNHCSGDVYYCKHWQEFSPPPEEDEKITSSPLAWSFCGASRYLQFARFAEATSAMGHYGWLAGDHRYSHIMAPSERLQGYG